MYEGLTEDGGEGGLDCKFAWEKRKEVSSGEGGREVGGGNGGLDW